MVDVNNLNTFNDKIMNTSNDFYESVLMRKEQAKKRCKLLGGKYLARSSANMPH